MSYGTATYGTTAYGAAPASGDEGGRPVVVDPDTIEATVHLGVLVITADVDLELPPPMTPPANVKQLYVKRVSEVMPKPTIVEGIPYDPEDD